MHKLGKISFLGDQHYIAQCYSIGSHSNSACHYIFFMEDANFMVTLQSLERLHNFSSNVVH